MTMQAWNEKGFARQLVSDELALPEGLMSPSGVKPSKRFSVYRKQCAGRLGGGTGRALPPRCATAGG